ncbi:MAG: DUF599 domain-containing protein [Pseudomonadota bacterium]
MTLFDFIPFFSVTDAVALCLIISAWFGIGWWIEHPGARRPSVTVMMSDYRREWMRSFCKRDVRIFDAQILASLRQGTAFFASSSLIAIGGLLALMGSADQISGLALSISDNAPPVIVYQIKLCLAGFFTVMAFLKFVWANRLFGYCAVVMGAVPIETGTPNTQKRAALAGELNVRAALNFNRGLRAMYFALAALVWIVGPWGLIFATITTAWTVWSREFMSLSRRLLEDQE